MAHNDRPALLLPLAQESLVIPPRVCDDNGREAADVAL